jgi:hypothetical protein
MRRALRRPRFDLFLSHSSRDAKLVQRLAASLSKAGLEAWVDASEMRYGRLLRNELQQAIGASRVLVLIWSAAAKASRWVWAELFTAFHLGRFIVPCVLDRTPLPQFLQTAAYLDKRREKTRLGDALARAVRDAPDRANDVPALLASQSPLVQQLTRSIGLSQYAVLDAMPKDLARARKANTSVRKALARLERLAPLDSGTLNLAGYQYKNDYLIKHWQPVQAGRAPKDPLLARGERCFFDSLAVKPTDFDAVNGMASILALERESDAAEFFERRALALAKRLGLNYEAAQQDLDMILYFKRLERPKPRARRT